jgi:hypothetical protein
MKMNKEERQAYNRAYNATHREEINKRRCQYYKAHKEEIRERSRRYRKAHREEINEKSCQYYKAHKEEIRENKSIETIELLEKCAKENARKK